MKGHDMNNRTAIAITSMWLAGAAFAATSDADREFVAKAAPAGAAEVALSQLATERAGSSQIRDFARRMIEDHSKAGEELKQIARSKGITVSEAPSDEQKAAQDKLRPLNGSAFDI